ncbi:MAG: hypothetical protein ABI905_14360 [Betaproteobacteria bacterium]
MKMCLFRKLLVAWMILWLPASGALAAMMPLSAMSAGQVQSQTSYAAAAQDTTAMSMPCHQPVAGKQLTGGCTHCVLCHLAVALMLPSMPHSETVTPSHDFTATPQLSPASFFPEPASPPPRSVAA